MVETLAERNRRLSEEAAKARTDAKRKTEDQTKPRITSRQMVKDIDAAKLMEKNPKDIFATLSSLQDSLDAAESQKADHDLIVDLQNKIAEVRKGIEDRQIKEPKQQQDDGKAQESAAQNPPNQPMDMEAMMKAMQEMNPNFKQNPNQAQDLNPSFDDDLIFPTKVSSPQPVSQGSGYTPSPTVERPSATSTFDLWASKNLDRRKKLMAGGMEESDAIANTMFAAPSKGRG